MQLNPVTEWQRLTEHYRTMSDGEVEELALDVANLTDTAQQVLRSELSSRGLRQPGGASNAPMLSGFSQSDRSDSFFNRSTAFSASHDELDKEDAESRESELRLPLCECEDWKHAWQVCAMLKPENIESWIQDAQGDIQDSILYSPEMGPPLSVSASRAFRVLVAADLLAEAREVAAQPVPREIVEASEINVPEFTIPKCPRCRAEDPVLLSVNPVNRWRCEQCEAEWDDAAAVTSLEGPGKG